MSSRESARLEVLLGLGVDRAAAEELLAYNRNVFQPAAEWAGQPLPLPDEPFVEAWAGYTDRAGREGAAAVLRNVLVQLHFPIRAGISEDAAYRAATRRGELPDDASAGIAFEDAAGLAIRLEQTPAGRVPVIVARSRADFEALVCAITARNEPQAIPTSVGAKMISGYVNWERVGRYRDRWLEGNPASAWPEELARLAPQKALYQDRFILASSGPYSGVEAGELGLEPARWRALSLEIRIGHECTHYCTRRAFGSMRNNLLDELIADYAGMVAATGRFCADWFLRFLGLEAYPAYRADGRLAAYRGEPPLSDRAFRVLQALVVQAARQVEVADARLAHVPAAQRTGRMLKSMAALTLEEIASGHGADLLTARGEPA